MNKKNNKRTKVAAKEVEERLPSPPPSIPSHESDHSSQSDDSPSDREEGSEQEQQEDEEIPAPANDQDTSVFERPVRVVIGSYGGVVYGLQSISSLESLLHSRSIDKRANEGEETMGEATLTTLFATDSHRGSIKSLTALSSGGFLASAGVDETIRVYNTRLLTEHGALHRHSGSITFLTKFKADFMFSCSEDGTIAIWDTHHWDCRSLLRGHKGAVNSLAIHPTGKIAASTGKDKTIRIWNLVNPQLATTRHLKEEAQLVLWSPSGNHYLLITNRTAQIYNTEGSATHQFECHSKILSAVYLSNDVFALGLDDHAIHLYDARTGAHVFEDGQAHQARVRSMDAMAVEGADEEGVMLVVSVSTDGVVNLWRFSPSAPALVRVATAASAARLTCVCFLPAYDANKEWKRPQAEEDVEKKKAIKEEAMKRKKAKKLAKLNAKLGIKSEPVEDPKPAQGQAQSNKHKKQKNNKPHQQSHKPHQQPQSARSPHRGQHQHQQPKKGQASGSHKAKSGPAIVNKKKRHMEEQASRFD